MSELFKTSYAHDADCDYFVVNAGERWSIDMVKRLTEKQPDKVNIVKENEDGTLIAHVPFEWMMVRPKTIPNLSDEDSTRLYASIFR